MWNNLMSTIGKHLPEIFMFLMEKIDWDGIKKWWTGKTIAVIGSTASGKNSFFARLKEEEIPSEYIQTRGTEKVKNFEIEQSLPDGKKLHMKVKGSVNVGGEVDERVRTWFEACKDADMIFYLIDYEKLTHKYEDTKKRIEDDFCWMRRNITKFSRNPYIFILMNKIDIDNSSDKIKTLMGKIEKLGKECLHDYYNKRIKGIFPISMTDDKIYYYSVLNILVSMDEVNNRK